MTHKVSGFKIFWTKLTHWEFWSFSVLYFPVNFYFAWLALKNRSFFFFPAANPTIDFGGMSGERKSEIYALIPKEYLPDMQLFQAGDTAALAFAESLGYPVVVKPDVGERGRLVEVIKCEEGLITYLKKCPVPFFVQELIDYPVELGVFYIRYPGEKKGAVSSLVQKEFMHVLGDGKSTVRDLLDRNPRALLQVDFSNSRFQDILGQVPAEGEKVTVESIGNHCRGTIFLNQNHQIDEALNRAFDQLASRIPGFHFGRFDLRCQSIEALKSLKEFKIMELNGAGAEPGHIYQPGYSLLRAYRDICWHLRTLAKISAENRKRGYTYWSFSAGMQKLKTVRAYTRMIKDA